MIKEYSGYLLDQIIFKVNKYSLKYPIGILVLGATGSGKSTTINAIFKDKITKVGDSCNPETKMISSYKLNDYIYFWDSPGLGDDPEKDNNYLGKIKDLLHVVNNGYSVIDLCLVIIEPKRDLGSTVMLGEELLKANISSQRILFAINQADFALKGRHWKNQTNSPDEELRNRLERLALSVQRRLKKDLGIEIIRPICFSAYYNWNITTLYKSIINHIPKENRKIIS